MAQLAEQPTHPLLAEEALKQLPEVVPDAARRQPAEKALKEPRRAPRRTTRTTGRTGGRSSSRSSTTRTSNLEDFVSVLAKWDDKQAKLDDKLVESSGALQQALSEAEWQELVRRISKPVAGGAGPG